MPSVEDKRREFRRLHESGCFAIPNPWDLGSARYLQHLGFKAIATTSAGFAFSRGMPDGAIKRDDMLAHIKELVEVTDIPVNADFENGYADDPDDVAESVRLCIATGVAGLSIEDAIDRKEKLVYEFDLAVERKPSNILIGGAIGLSMEDAAVLGARRVSVGGAFARAAWGGFIRSAKELIEKGTFDELANAASYEELQKLFGQN